MGIRTIKNTDIKQCIDIYNYYIKNTTITLEMEEISEEEFLSRVLEYSKDFPYLVYEDNGKIVGYAYMHHFSPRGGYRYTAESTVYVDDSFKGKGIGKSLMVELLDRAKDLGIRDVLAVVTSENENSIEFHQHIGFENKAVFDGVADKFGRRFSVVYLQYKIC